MRPVIIGTLFIIITFALFYSCSHEADLSGFPEICFEGEVLPIFLNSCATTECHDGQGESDLILSSYQDIMNGIVPGDPGASDIYQAITSSSGFDLMPPDQPLTQDNRTLIRLWIEQGARNTVCPEIIGPK
jgi:hypothetical protein